MAEKEGNLFELKKTVLIVNDEEINRDILSMQLSNDFNILEAYKANDIKQVFTWAHALKGVCGNLALTTLFDAACELTEATRDKESANIDKEIEKLKEAYELIDEKFKSLA